MATTVNSISEDDLKKELSTFYDKTYVRTSFMDTVLDDDAVAWVDPLSPSLLAMLSSMSYDNIQYDGQPITSLSYKYYGNTSLWWFIVLVNGFINPHEIPMGYILKIPKLTYINEAINRKNKNSIKGQIVTI